MKNILDYDLSELKLWMKENNESEFRATQVFQWIYKGASEFNDMKNLPKALIEKLNNTFHIELPSIVHVLKSEDETYKFLLSYSDGNIIETVVMKYNYGNSICVSTQIGCKMGCKFCASTLGGIVRNLSSGEILAEVLVAQKYINERISNIVLMGSGEPLDNYSNVVKFISLANADYGLNIGQRHITLSTCGIVPKIYELSKLKLQITLAISLHSPNDDLRRSMMPIANKYSIEELIKACSVYIEETNRRITFEYALVFNTNDSKENAEELGRLLKGMLCHVNLIPVNEVAENNFKKSTNEQIYKFQNVLEGYGIETTVRREMGSDINAACGQLRRSFIQSNSPEKE
ncbi:23S rRNA (adenine(2503)-C(2))-methyltransferase RlmN [Candidatus Clostridium radicumherbarum]|uniref:Probable dual-specificity RNA methyltransferase RlmN n=1 Tax=Candidatus Clostridium radicumherbarum TaxID=3381662 RepID=A0ABW8TSC6_9CLOT